MDQAHGRDQATDRDVHVFDTGSVAPPSDVECFVHRLDADAVCEPDNTTDARERERPRLLDGVAVAVKDIIAVAGTTMRAGSRVYAREITEDSAAVGLLRAHGARILGTTRTHELALGPTGLNPHDLDGGLKNPHDPTRIAGGSSSGSAVAVTLGICPIALGTDTGGSVRAPAALCGIVGFKPSYGIIPLYGVLPASPTLDHVGIFARRVSDMRVAAEALGVTPAPAAHDGLEHVRIGVLAAEVGALDATVDTTFTAAVDMISGHAASVETVELATEDLWMDISSTILFYEASRVHAEVLADRADDLSPLVRMRLENGAKITPGEYRHALRERQIVLAELAQVFARYDVLVNPTVSVVAPLVEDAADPATVASVIRNTRLANIVGNPALSLPLPGAHLPVGMQVAAARGNDARVLNIAAAIEAVLAR